ncbi:ester cyclase [Streptomyces sp. NPDC008137]|uniref:ester cyclase n=1 Tax=Streptomyces sp. NPDC008137 TaxID=3364813 RepID=UPI0036F13833
MSPVFTFRSDHNPATDASGIDGMRASIAAVRDGFTGAQHRILFQQELPGGWVVLHWRMTATHTGDALGFPASGNPVDINGQLHTRRVAGPAFRTSGPGGPAGAGQDGTSAGPPLRGVVPLGHSRTEPRDRRIMAYVQRSAARRIRGPRIADSGSP